jgi:predicted nucleotidyltransferase
MIDPGHDETCQVWDKKSKQFGIIYAMLTPILIHDLESVKNIVLEQLKAYKAKVYLFGSQATGKARLYSDIDIAILPLQPLPILALFEIREKLEESDIVREVDVLDLSETEDIFRQRVEKEGILWKE